MQQSDNLIRWGAERRLEFIEFCLFWDGQLQRSDITERFNVSVPQASSDISTYQKVTQDNIRYDASLKRYVPTENFTCQFLKPNAERYLTQLRAIADGVIDKNDTWISHLPYSDALIIPQRKVDPYILRDMLLAIKKEQSIDILYQSMNPDCPEPMWRRITPHSFGFDGLRWHVRAFCHMANQFKDFVLSRCSGVKDFSNAGALRDDDIEWNTFFEVIIIPDPNLSEGHQKAIASDYCMQDGKLILPVRRALLFYFDKRMKLDLDKNNFGDTQICISNIDEYRKALTSKFSII